MALARPALSTIPPTIRPSRSQSAAHTTPRRWPNGGTARTRTSVTSALRIPGLRDAGCHPERPFDAAIRDALLQALFGAGSELLILPFQDIFGWRDRVNVPAVVNDENWTWRLPWPIDELCVLPDARERAAFLRALARQSAR